MCVWGVGLYLYGRRKQGMFWKRKWNDWGGKVNLMTSYIIQSYIKSKIKTIATKERMKSVEYEIK